MTGPENDVSIAATSVPDVLYYAPAPRDAPNLTPAGYLLVGYNQPPELPWDGQVRYALDREASDLRPHPEYEGMEEGQAVYVLEGES